MQLLSPMLFLVFINPPSTQIILSKQRLRFNLIFNSVLILVRGFSITVGNHILPTVNTLKIFKRLENIYWAVLEKEG